MWIETHDGTLVNMDKVQLVMIKEGLGAHELIASGKYDYVLFRGTLDECQTAKEALPMPIAWKAGKLYY